MPKRVLGFVLLALVVSGSVAASTSASVFNVRDYGARGLKSDNAQPAIQKAVEACAAAGGGTVYVPPGEYTASTIFLRSHVRVFIEAGATLYASQDPSAYAKDTLALFYGMDLFYSMNWFGPATPCENITVTNCRLSSASSAIKFCDGNMNCVRKVTISNCVITDSNRGLASMVFDGGYVSDVVISDLTIDCRRHKWFWWGDGDPFHFNIKRRSEIMSRSPQPGEPAAGSIRNVKLSNIVARGKGSSLINGHPDSWLDGLTMDNITLILSNDPEAQIQKVKNAFQFRWARNIKVRKVEVLWDKPESERWESALSFKDVKGLTLTDVSARQATAGAATAAIVLEQVEDAIIRQAKAQPGTSVFLEVRGDRSKEVYLLDSDLRGAEAACRVGPGATEAAIKVSNNLTKKK